MERKARSTAYLKKKKHASHSQLTCDTVVQDPIHLLFLHKSRVASLESAKWLLNASTGFHWCKEQTSKAAKPGATPVFLWYFWCFSIWEVLECSRTRVKSRSGIHQYFVNHNFRNVILELVLLHLKLSCHILSNSVSSSFLIWKVEANFP